MAINVAVKVQYATTQNSGDERYLGEKLKNRAAQNNAVKEFENFLRI